MPWVRITASQAVFTGIRSLLNSIFEGVPFDNALAFDFKRYLGADEIPVNPTASLPSRLVWNEQFGLVLRNEGSFSGTANPDIIVGFRTALVAAGAGEDILIGFDQAQMKGGVGRDWLLGAGSAKLFGDGDNDLLVATDLVKADGGAGNDILVGIGSQYKSQIEKMELRGGDGDDWVFSYKGTGAFLYGGEGSDFLLAYGGDRFLFDINAAFNSSTIGIDTITDFLSGTDKIVLDKTTFTALTSAVGSTLSTSEFATINASTNGATIAGGSNARIVFNRANGDLFYNANGATAGNGSGGQFATLSGVTSLGATDFLVQA